jgi:hypothetical protein
MKQEYVIKAAYYKGKIDAVEELIKTINGFVMGSDDGITTVEMYRDAISNLERRICYEIGEIKLV